MKTHMQHLGAEAGDLHRREDMPMLSTAALTEWAEAQRRQGCKGCAGWDACAEQRYRTACAATLRRAFKRAYRVSYEEAYHVGP